jgi:plastocyanin
LTPFTITPNAIYSTRLNLSKQTSSTSKKLHFMMFKLAAFAALVSLAVIPKVKATDFQVIVGGGPLQYNPNQVTAQVGDTVTFVFKQANHTATESTLQDPCSPKAGGFDSGFIPVAADVTEDFPLAQFNVVDTNPRFVYCKQANHCQQGMVFAINAGSDFTAFQAAAQASGGGSVSATATSAGATPSATSTGTNHQVVVGGTDKIFYDPANITAAVGDTITFQFQVKNHTVTQSSFATPCRSLTSTSTTGQIGFDSGFMPVAANATDFPTYTITVNDTAPIWAYCRQTSHCGEGMVFAVNAVESGPNTFEAFQAAAKAQNGTTATSSGSSVYPSSTGTNGAMRINRDAGIAIAAVAAAFGLLL